MFRDKQDQLLWDRQVGSNLEEFLHRRSLFSEIRLGNAASLLITIALAEQAQAGLTTEGVAPKNVRARLCELTKIPTKKQTLIVDFKPRVAWKGDIQAIYLEPVIQGFPLKGVYPPFFSFGALVKQKPSIIFARPSLETDGAFLSLTSRPFYDTFNSIMVGSAISSLLWAHEGDYTSIPTHPPTAKSDPVIEASEIIRQVMFTNPENTFLQDLPPDFIL